jgi:hypothetical protein
MSLYDHLRKRPSGTVRLVVAGVGAFFALAETVSAIKELVPRKQPETFKVHIVQRAGALCATGTLEPGETAVVTVSVLATDLAAAVSFTERQSLLDLGRASA